MQKSLTILTLGVLMILGLGACNKGEENPHGTAANSPATTAGEGVTYEAPTGWIREEPSSGMRKGQYRLPHAEGDIDDAEMAIFHFPNQGGSVKDNVDRWIGQFSNPDGSPAADATQVKKKEVGGTTVTVVDLSGTYSSAMGPMMTSGPPKPNYRMLAAIVETSSGPWFFKLTGPANTLAKWEKSFDEFTNSIRVH